jgi:hypothetical protein
MLKERTGHLMSAVVAASPSGHVAAPIKCLFLKELREGKHEPQPTPRLDKFATILS